MSLAKGIADGVPMGAVVAKKEIADVFKPGDHGSTFGGSCLAIAACAATLSALVHGDYAEHAAKVGAYMEQALAKLPHVVEVRGRGLMLGCDLDAAADQRYRRTYAALPSAARVRRGRRGQPDRDPGGCFGLTRRNNLIWTGFRTADVPYAARFSGLEPVLLSIYHGWDRPCAKSGKYEYGH